MGAGASTSAASYPSRLAEELGKHFPGHEFTVLNRGVNGEEITDMLARFDTAVIAERPDLVLWQVGVIVRGRSAHELYSVVEALITVASRVEASAW